MSDYSEQDALADLAFLKDPNPAVRLDAAIRLARDGQAQLDALPVLVGEIGSVTPESEQNWIWALQRIGNPSIGVLAEKAMDESTPHERRVLALRTIACDFFEGFGQCASQMETLLDHPTNLSDYAAVILARNIQPVHAHPAFLRALASSDERLVEHAAGAMHCFKNRHAEEVRKLKAAVLPLFRHPNQSVRNLCHMMVVLPVDAQDLRDVDLDDPLAVSGMVNLLCKMEHPPVASVDVLLKGLESEDYDCRETYAPHTLRRLGDAALPRVTEIALDPGRSEQARRGALRVLAGQESLPETTLQALRTMIDALGSASIEAAVILAKHRRIDDAVVARLIAGVGDSRAGVYLKKLPSEQVIPLLIGALHAAEPRQKSDLAKLLSEIGFASQPAADAVAVEIAKEADWNRRNYLGNWLANFEELAVPAVRRALGDADDDQTIHLMEGLSFVGAKASQIVPDLLPLLENRKGLVSFHAALALASIDPLHPAAHEWILAGLASDSIRIRNQALYRVEWLTDSAGLAPYLPRLIELLDDPQSQQRSSQVLAKHGQAALPALPRLIQMCEEGSYEGVEAVKRIRHPDALPALLRLLDRQQNIKHALAAIEWIGSGDAVTVEKLRPMLSGPFRREVVKTLGALGPAAALVAPDLIQLLDEPDRELRVAAILALGQLRSAEDRLLTLATSNNPAIRDAAMTALGLATVPAAIPLLLAAMESADEELAKAAIFALAKYRADVPPGFVDLLLRRFDESEDLRWAALHAFEVLGAGAAPAVPRLLPLLTDSNCSETAFSILRAIGPAAQAAAPELERLSRTFRYRVEARVTLWAVAPDRAAELGLTKVW